MLSIGEGFVYITIIVVVVGMVNIVDMVRRHRHDSARWTMCAMLLLGSVAFLVQVPSVIREIDRVAGIPNVAVLLEFCLFVFAGGLVHLWISLWPGTNQGPSRAGILAAVIAGCGSVVLTAFFAIGTHRVEEPTRFVAVYATDPASAAMVFCYAGLFAGLWGVAAIRMRRVRISGEVGRQRWLEHGLRMMEWSVYIAELYMLAFAAIPVGALLGAHDSGWVEGVRSIDVVSGVMACLGVGCRVWAPTLERMVDRGAGRRLARAQCRQLEPLYRLVSEGDRGSFLPRRGLGLLRRDPATALAHQVCAILEHSAALAGYRDEWVEAEAEAWGAAVAEAIRLVAAARARRAGCPPPVAGVRSPVDMGAEIERQQRLATALTMLAVHRNSGRLPAPIVSAAVSAPA